MEAKDGSFGFDFEAVYNEIVEGEKFIYTLTDGRKVEVLFKQADKNKGVVITFDVESQNSLELQKTGWQAILDNFKRYAASH